MSSQSSQNDFYFQTTILTQENPNNTYQFSDEKQFKKTRTFKKNRKGSNYDQTYSLNNQKFKHGSKNFNKKNHHKKSGFQLNNNRKRIFESFGNIPNQIQSQLKTLSSETLQIEEDDQIYKKYLNNFEYLEEFFQQNFQNKKLVEDIFSLIDKQQLSIENLQKNNEILQLNNEKLQAQFNQLEFINSKILQKIKNQQLEQILSISQIQDTDDEMGSLLKNSFQEYENEQILLKETPQIKNNQQNLEDLYKQRIGKRTKSFDQQLFKSKELDKVENHNIQTTLQKNQKFQSDIEELYSKEIQSKTNEDESSNLNSSYLQDCEQEEFKDIYEYLNYIKENVQFKFRKFQQLVQNLKILNKNYYLAIHRILQIQQNNFAQDFDENQFMIDIQIDSEKNRNYLNKQQDDFYSILKTVFCFQKKNEFSQKLEIQKQIFEKIKNHKIFNYNKKFIQEKIDKIEYNLKQNIQRVNPQDIFDLETQINSSLDNLVSQNDSNFLKNSFQFYESTKIGQSSQEQEPQLKILSFLKKYQKSYGYQDTLDLRKLKQYSLELQRKIEFQKEDIQKQVIQLKIQSNFQGIDYYKSKDYYEINKKQILYCQSITQQLSHFTFQALKTITEQSEDKNVLKNFLKILSIELKNIKQKLFKCNLVLLSEKKLEINQRQIEIYQDQDDEPIDLYESIYHRNQKQFKNYQYSQNILFLELIEKIILLFNNQFQ